MVATGVANVVTTCAADVAEQPDAFVTVTVYEPAADTMMDCVVAPVDQTLPVVDEEVRVMVLPGQTNVGPLMVGVTAPEAAATTKGAEVAEQPAALVTLTV